MSIRIAESEINHDEIYTKVAPSDRVAALDHIDAAMTVLYALKGKDGQKSNEVYRALFLAYNAVLHCGPEDEG
jgi:hypothetical protein